MTDINLVPEEEKIAQGYESLHKKLATAAILLLVLAAVSTLAVLAFFTVLVSKRNSLVSQIEDSSARVNSFKETEDLVFVTKGKAAAAEKVLGSRRDLNNIFAKLAELVPQNVYFTDLKISGAKLDITGRAKTSADMAGLISQLVSEKGQTIVSNVSIGSLASDESGRYSFTLSTQTISKPKGQE